MANELEMTTERPPISVRRRVFYLIGGLIVCVLGLAIVRWQYERYVVTITLEEYVAKLDTEDPGWRLEELEAARKDPPPGENSADVCVLVAKMVPGGWPAWDFDKSADFSNLEPPELLDEKRARILADEMNRVAAVVEVAHRLTSLPYGKFQIRWAANPLDILLEDQQNVRRSAALLNYDAMNRAQQNDVPGALLAGRACINAGRSLGDDPVALSQLIRVSVISVGLGILERTLAQGQANDADLAEIQQLLRLEEQHRTHLVMLRGERATAHQIFEMLKSSKISPSSLAAGPSARSGWWSMLYDKAIGLGIGLSNLSRQQMVSLEMFTEMIEASKLPPSEQIKREAEIENRIKGLPTRDWAVKLLMPATSRMNEIHRRKLSQVRVMDALIAVERHRLKHGTWPDLLEDVAKEFLPKVPLDPYDGNPIRYQRTAEGVVVYTLGDNLVDDGGKVVRDPRGGRSLDYGYRLWDVDKRRQPPQLDPVKQGRDQPGEPE